MYQKLRLGKQLLVEKIYASVFRALGLHLHPEKHQSIKRLLCVNDIATGRLPEVHRYSPFAGWRQTAQYPRGFEGHAWFLYTLCQAIGAKTILEFGIREGVSSLILAAAAQSNNGLLVSVDPSNKYRDFVAYNMKYYGLAQAYRRFQDDSIHFLSVWQSQFKSQLIDLVMIDSKHEFKLKQQEIRQWLPLVRPGGAMVFHDVVHCADNNQAAITDFLANTKCCFIKTDGWLLPDDELVAHVHNAGHRVNFNTDTWQPFRQVPNPEGEQRPPAIFPRELQNISHAEAGHLGFQYSYEIRTNCQGLGVLVKHY